MPELAVLRFVVLDDDYITDDFIGQYSVSIQCLQPGFRTVPLLGLVGRPVPHASLFVHVLITELKGSGKRARRAQDSVALHSVGVRALDDTFRSASAPLGEATDLRVSTQVGALPVTLLWVSYHSLPRTGKHADQSFSSVFNRVQWLISRSTLGSPWRSPSSSAFRAWCPSYRPLMGL